MIYYTYKVTKNDTGEYYLGRRQYHGTDITKDLYLGSGTRIKRMVKKYGRCAFTKTILDIHETVDDLIKAEELLITEEHLHNPLCLNIALGGGTSWDAINFSPIAKQNFLETVKSDAYRRNMSEVINSPEVKARISESIKKTMSSPEWKQKFSETQRRVQNTDHERERNRQAQLIAQNRADVKEKKRLKTKEVFEDEAVRKKHREAITGRMLVNKGGVTKNIKPDELRLHIDDGWLIGRYVKNPTNNFPNVYMHDAGVKKRIRLNNVIDKLRLGWQINDVARARITQYSQLECYRAVCEPLVAWIQQNDASSVDCQPSIFV